MHRYGFRHPADVQESWSYALLHVMSNAIVHNNYTPPPKEEAAGPKGEKPRNPDAWQIVSEKSIDPRRDLISLHGIAVSKE